MIHQEAAQVSDYSSRFTQLLQSLIV